jgi:hypothetical protein
MSPEGVFDLLDGFDDCTVAGVASLCRGSFAPFPARPGLEVTKRWCQLHDRCRLVLDDVHFCAGTPQFLPVTVSNLAATPHQLVGPAGDRTDLFPLSFGSLIAWLAQDEAARRLTVSLTPSWSGSPASLVSSVACVLTQPS